MNVWKVSTIILGAGLIASIGTQVALAQPNPGECRNQPNMATALVALRSARLWLERAEHNKDGWRFRAIQAVDTALLETNTGCAAAAGP